MGLQKETQDILAKCMKAGFDGVVLDMDEALDAARLYAVPKPENDVADIFAQAARIIRKGNPRAVIIAHCGNAFIHSLDESHYAAFMSSIDGVLPASGNGDAAAYAQYGVKVFSSQNFSPTSDEYQTASGGKPDPFSAGAYSTR